MASRSISPLMRILSSSISVSHRAGGIIREIFKKGELGIVDKGTNDLQTEADRSAQKCIVSTLKNRFPQLTVNGEEEQDDDGYGELEMGDTPEVLAMPCPPEYINAKEEEFVVWVDPLDGTSEYAIGLLECVTVLIGICYKGQAVAGVIYQPFFGHEGGADAEMGRCVWGVVGIGAFGYKPLSPPSGRIIATTRAHCDEIVQAGLDACEPTSIMRVGGAGNKILLLLEGEVHAYVYCSLGLKKWDTAAPEAVLRAAGGELTDIYGERIPYQDGVPKRNYTGTIATLLDHQFYVSRIPEKCKAALKPRDK